MLTFIFDSSNDDTGANCICSIRDGSSKPQVQPRVGDSCEAMGYDNVYAVHFADLNGDGRAEYLWVDENGAVTYFLNLGSSIDQGPGAAEVDWLPQGVIATGVGAECQEVQFADLNGDRWSCGVFVGPYEWLRGSLAEPGRPK